MASQDAVSEGVKGGEKSSGLGIRTFGFERVNWVIFKTALSISPHGSGMNYELF